MKYAIGMVKSRFQLSVHPPAVALRHRLELLACVQMLQGLELNASPLAESAQITLTDGDGEGNCDQASGHLAAALCP